MTTLGSFLGSSRFCSFPAGFEGFLPVLLVCVLAQRQRVRVEKFDAPCDVFSLLVLCLAFGPEMEIKDGLDDIVVFDLFALVR